jgi:uncharacterized protein with von Willebrand factor type A (vWA) domain
MILRQTSLSGNIIQFCRFLRQKGFAAGIEEELLALQALQCIDFGNNAIFYEALKAILCRNGSQRELFRNLYDEYWKGLTIAVDSKEIQDERYIKKNEQKDSFKSLKDWLNRSNNKGSEETATYSPTEKFSERDFSAISEEETEEIMHSIKALAKSLAAKLSRRYEQTDVTGRPDIRRTLRKNMRRGGELLEIVHKRPKRNRTKLIAICDVSRSMDLYTAFLIQFLYAMQQVYRRTETFLFSTTIQRVTNVLKETNFDSVKQLLRENHSWSDGTRIGESLETFTQQFGNKTIDSKTIVIILSDGWDTWGIEKLEKSMQDIQSRAKKIIWLNPMAGYQGYKPETIGMKAALPYIDILAPVHNLESLKRLAKWLR